MNYSKELSAFSEFPPPVNFANFMNHAEVLEYLNLYAEHFDLLPYIRFQNEVIGVSRTDGWKETGRWRVDVIDM